VLRLGRVGQELIRMQRFSILAAIASLLLVPMASAQTKESLRRTIFQLQQAETLSNSISEFFRVDRADDSTVSVRERRTNNFRKLRGATEVFVRLAPKAIADDVLHDTQLMFSGRPGPAPQTLPEAIEECEKRNDEQLTRLVASELRTALSAAKEDWEAEANFGPLSDKSAVYSSIVPPASGAGLLRNLAFVLDHDAVLRRDFYTVENLHRFFAMRPTVYRRGNGDIWGRWVVRPTEVEARTLEPGASRYAQCQYSVALQVLATDKKRGGIAIACNFKLNDGFGLDDVERVFGPDWQDAWQMPVHGPPPPRTAVNGNTRMAYDFDKGSLHRAIEVSFGPDAVFNVFDLRIEER
jgi:hypothetical protein